MFLSEPVDRSSITDTLCPAARSLSLRWEPINPAPPVTRMDLRVDGWLIRSPLRAHSYPGKPPPASASAARSFLWLEKPSRRRQWVCCGRWCLRSRASSARLTTLRALEHAPRERVQRRCYPVGVTHGGLEVAIWSLLSAQEVNVGPGATDVENVFSRG